jgi:beta-lactamase class A
VKFAAVLLPVALLAQTEASLPRLEQELERLAGVAGGVVGATAIHMETGRRVSIRGQERFPMASTFKVPIAVQLLTLVDEGKEQLERMVLFEAKDLHPGSGTLSDLFTKPGLALSVRNLMELMLLISDNSTTDMLLRQAGGADAVNARMHSLGIEGIHLDRSTALLIADAVGVENLPPEEQWTLEMFGKLMRQVPREARDAARQRFDADPRDTSTPDGMAQLLSRIYRKDLLKPASADLLLDIMKRCRTGDTRLKGLLPTGTEIAHKTGTISASANDVGIVTLPNGAGHLALAVFVKSSTKEPALRDRAIAEIARAVHDYFVFEPAAAPGRNYEAMADRIVSALHLKGGEHVRLRPDPGYFEALLPPLRRRLAAAGARETEKLDDAEIYLWLPLRPGGPQLPAAEREALRKWIDLGGARRQVHFHWGEGSVLPDGLYGEHTPALDAIDQAALDIDYAALGAAQDKPIAQLRSGIVRVRTPAGTDIRFRTGDRPFNKQDGDASAERATAARTRIDRDIELPAGVLRVAPIEETANGVIVIPEARFGEQSARGVRLEFRNGRIIRVEAQENLAAVEAYLTANGDAARRFREFGLGFNSKLTQPPGSRALAYYGYGKGIVRLSLGDNEEVGGKVRGGFTRWFFFPDAVVEVDGKLLRLE